MAQTRAQRKVGAISIEPSISREILLLNHFLVQGIDVDAKNKYGNTPLHITCFYGKLEVARMLFDHGATANVENEKGETPLHLVSREYDSEQTGVDIARLLLEHGADVNSKDKDQDTPLHKAVLEGRLEIARTLLDHGANTSGGCNSHRAKYFMRNLTPKPFPSARHRHKRQKQVRRHSIAPYMFLWEARDRTDAA